MKTKFRNKQKRFSFDGINFKTEASSQFPHSVMALGSYRNSPFVTGHYDTNGLNTEILDYAAGEWKQEADYPFSNGDRFIFST